MDKNKMIKENLTITKEDSTLAKLTKFCAWIGIIFCFFIFATVWVIFFIILGGPTLIYKIFNSIHKARIQRKQHLIGRKKIYKDEEVF